MQPLTPATVDRLAALLRTTTAAAAARELGISKSTAALWRRRLNIAPAPRQAANRSELTLTEKWATFTRPAAGGHLEWTGRRRADSGVMVFTHHGREYTARAAAFRVRTGRAPEGTVTAECDYPGCVAPGCVEDEPGRTRSRRHLAAVRGIDTGLAECTRGHATAVHRRYDRDGRPYCGTCHAEAAAARQAAA